jgi:sulfur-carrier protein adenylyltransferase/sulfurtransferase
MNQGPLKTYLTGFAHQLRWVECSELDEMSIAEVCLLDVRESHEFESMHINGAISLPRGRIELEIETVLKDPMCPIVVVCKSDLRARLASRTLDAMGFGDVRVLRGGMEQWVKAGRTTIGGSSLTAEDFERYARHLSLPNFTSAHQSRLRGARVLVVGCGGLGSPVIAYLAAAGIGTLRVVDFDRVDVSNLQRQVIHKTSDVGREKVESAKAFVAGLNPNVTVEAHVRRVDESNAAALFSQVDVVVDGSDSIETRYLLNQFCVKLSIPYVYGAVFRDEGEFAFFDVGAGSACYRCLHPNPIPAELNPSCAQAGVLGVVPGMIGMLQANATLNYLLGHDGSVDACLVKLTFGVFKAVEFQIERNAGCPTCSGNAVERTLT